MDNPSVSIIVPVYRTPDDLLRRFLESALNQTFHGIQLIAVDDASPDHCPGILDAAAAQDHRVTVLHRKTNGRAGMARNDGLDLVKGQYVFFADADDILHPELCETLLDLAVRHDADITACSWKISDPSGRLAGRHGLSDSRYDLTSARQRARAYRNMTHALWNKLFRYETIRTLRFEQFEANIGEDTLFNIAALCRSRTMVSTPYCGYDYTIHSASATGRSAKGMPYLHTLEQSGTRITQTISAEDGSAVGRKYADLMALKRFSTGCEWIAANPVEEERDALWGYWKQYLHEQLLPSLDSRVLLAMWYRLVTACGDAHAAYRLTWAASRMADPLAMMDRIKARRTSKRH